MQGKMAKLRTPEEIQDADERGESPPPETPGELRGEEGAESSDLTTPVLLVAMPQVLDPFFHMSVVLLIDHHEQGSLGFIVNRPTRVPLSDILEGFEIPWRGKDEQTAYFGGPVQPQLGTVIYRPSESHGETENETENENEIYAGAALTQNVNDLQELAAGPPQDLRLFLGYAGWGEGQLLSELLRNDWVTVPVHHDLVFVDDPAEAWRAALRSVGIDPEALTSWTSQDADAPAN